MLEQYLNAFYIGHQLGSYRTRLSTDISIYLFLTLLIYVTTITTMYTVRSLYIRSFLTLLDDKCISCLFVASSDSSILMIALKWIVSSFSRSSARCFSLSCSSLCSSSIFCWATFFCDCERSPRVCDNSPRDFDSSSWRVLYKVIQLGTDVNKIILCMETAFNSWYSPMYMCSNELGQTLHAISTAVRIC